ncbi:major facilitator superfamily (MFS) transporter [Candidatus Koribacter versatilis Ellin345]|uniref:Major facilitator superfamily (MFS) transporter n=1 Tax=Koribacter versatilis (strain Ellin345) TaxID=204669 RepID=Q1IV52_KORVE|nr:MFS transporter [Candidatus Koribacter versatilis]ABF39248.1 major facilitator superfamily (MFS) transporter [Candidatus Koribacter versatilis Ellin345]
MPDRPHPHRWSIAILLGVGVLVNYFDRVNLSIAHDQITREFGLTTVGFGYLLSAYSFTYALCQIPAGAILDRFGVRLVGRVSTVLWSIASFASAFSNGARQFFATRLLLGVGEAPTFPGNAKAVSKWFPENERGLATACFDCAAKFSSAIGVPIMGLLLVRVGWRGTFLATGIASFAYFLLFTMVYRDPEEEAPTVLESPVLETGILDLLGDKKVAGLAIGSAAYNYCFYLLLAWLPAYLSTSMHLNLLQSAWYTSIPWVVATATDLLVGGWLVDALIRRGFDASRVRQSILIGGTSLGVAIFAAGSATTPGQAIFWISVSIGGLAAAAPVGWSVPGLIAPPGSVGRVGGIMNFASQLAAISAPIVTGYVVAYTHSFEAAFWLAAIFLTIGIAAYALLLGRIERVESQNL